LKLDSKVKFFLHFPAIDNVVFGLLIKKGVAFRGGFSFWRLPLSVVVALGFPFCRFRLFTRPTVSNVCFVLRFSSPSGAQRVVRKRARERKRWG